jgi:hypothetical protein
VAIRQISRLKLRAPALEVQTKATIALSAPTQKAQQFPYGISVASWVQERGTQENESMRANFCA